MTYLTGEVTVVHDWTKIDFTNFVYSAFRFNDTAAGPTTTINGATITKVVGITVDSVIDENTTTIDEDLILLGNPQPALTTNIKGAATGEYLSKYSFNFIGNNEHQWFSFGIIDEINDWTGSITVSGYAKPELLVPPGEDGTIIDNYDATGGFSLRQDRGDELWIYRIRIGGGFIDVKGTSAPLIGEWSQVVGVWNSDNGDFKIYVNGVLETTDSYPGDVLQASDQPLRIGAGSNATGEMLGMVNNVAIWHTALSDEEVLTHFNNGNPYNLILDGPKPNELKFWSKVGDNSSWNGSDQWTIVDEISKRTGESNVDGGFTPMTYTSRVKDAP